MFRRDVLLSPEFVLLDVEVCDLVREVLGFDGDGWQKVGQCAVMALSMTVAKLRHWA